MNLRMVLGMGCWIVAGGCHHEQPNVIYMPDMVYTPAVKAQTGRMRMPPDHAVPRDFQPYSYLDTESAGKNLINPVRAQASSLKRGKEMFGVYCAVCHGPSGEGNGSIIPKFTMPPSLLSAKVRQWPDGSIYHVIQKGQNLMPSYAAQIEASDRWAIVHYIRAFQRAKTPSVEDVKKFEQEVL